MYKISIIVPVYRVEKELERCVKSLINQTYSNIEILLVDDGSPDRCPKMCDEFARADKRVRVIHKKNGGLSDARNVGLEAATGEYIMYVDSDDYIELDACERLILEAKKGVDVIVGACKEVNGSKISYMRHTNLKPGKIYCSSEYIIRSIKNNEWFAPACFNVYRKDFLIENNLQYKVGYCFEDMEILPRLFLAATGVTYVDYPFYNYIIREGSITTSGLTDEKKKMALDIYASWIYTFESLEDKLLQRYLFGVLVRYYMTTARRMKIYGWQVSGVDFKFAWMYAINWKDRAKVMIFNFSPTLYMKL